MEEVIILFDEQGTPTFRIDKETSQFLGVSVTYRLSDEDKIFKEADSLLGLSKSEPLKNDKLDSGRAELIAKFLISQNILITIASLDLNNQELQDVVSLYEDLGNIIRERYRKIRSRPKAQIIHSQVLDYVLFLSISEWIRINQTSSRFSIFIDNWAFPQNDIKIIKELTSKSLVKFNNQINKVHFSGVEVFCNDVEFLSEDSQKKRFIDVVTSVLSRGFLNPSTPKFSDTIFKIITQDREEKLFYEEITGKSIEQIRGILDIISRNMP